MNSKQHTPRRRIRATKSAAHHILAASRLLEHEAGQLLRTSEASRPRGISYGLRDLSNSVETILRKARRIPPQPASDGAVEVQL